MWSRFRSWLGATIRRSHMESEMDAELRFHMEGYAEDLVRSGVAGEEAMRRARLEFGGIERAKEECREARGVSMLESLIQDVGYGTRMLCKSPGFTAVVVLTLALGMGANTAVFSVVNGVLLQPFPFPKQDQLVLVWEKDSGGLRSNTSFATYTDWSRLNQSFTEMAAISFWTPTLVRENDAENLLGFRVSAPFFDLLGVRMERGRNFLPEEDTRGKNFSVILSHGLWARMFGSDPAIGGKAINLNGRTYSVVGVLPANFPSVFSFDPRKPAEIYMPLGYDATLPYACRTCNHLRAVARIRDGFTLKQAGTEMNGISENLFRAYPKEYGAPGVILTSLRDYVVGDVQAVLFTLLGSVGFVLLIACVNVANLILGWVARRHREITVRAALGADRTRLVRQFLTESVLLSLLGGALGLALAFFGNSALQMLQPGILPRLGEVHMDLRVFGFTLGLSLLTGILFGLIPAWRASKPNLNEGLKEGNKSSSGRQGRYLGRVLVGCDVALALVLLIGAGLLMRSFVRLLDVKPGFDASNVLTLQISLWGANYKNDAPTIAFYQQALERVRVLPGVEDAAIVSQLPLGGNLDKYGLIVEDKPEWSPEKNPSADRYSISPAYLRTMGIPLLHGREFTAQDAKNSPAVVMVSQTLAQLVWPGEDAIGKQIRISDPKGPWRTVVGVTGDVLHTGLDAAHTPQLYLPHTQFTDSDMLMVVRAAKDPAVLGSAVRGEIAAVDPLQPVYEMEPMREIVASSVAQRRFSAQLFQLFAAIALVLACVGIYGVVSFAVAQRTREIGIRMALGAGRREVLAIVLREGMKPVLVGAVAGLAAALGLTQLLKGFLFGVKPTDPATFAIICLVLVIAAVLACAIPARRATRVDPMVALRYE